MSRLLGGLLVALALVVALPASARAELKAIWGPNNLPNGHSAFTTYRKLHVDVLQRQLQWSDVAETRPAHPRDPHDPAYHWPSDLATAVTRAHRSGIQLALMIKDAPGWENGGFAGGRPGSARDVADFAVAAARHYRHVKYWMVWGEPARPGNFEPWDDVAGTVQFYAEILDQTYGALKSVRRSNVVIGGMTFVGQTPWLPDYLRLLRLPNGKPPRLDWFGHNPYGVRYPRLSSNVYDPRVRDMSDIDVFVNEVRAVYAPIHRRPRLWLSEFNVQSDHSSAAFGFFVSRRAQAHWLTAAYKIAHREPYVAGLGWYELLDTGAPYHLSGGLMTKGGKRKPAWAAYRRAP